MELKPLLHEAFLSRQSSETPDEFPYHYSKSGRYVKVFKRKENRVPDLIPNASSKKTLMINWKGKILRPTYLQLREFRGNFNDILSSLGGEASPYGMYSEKIAIQWKNRTLWATPPRIHAQAYLQAQKAYISVWSLAWKLPN